MRQFCESAVNGAGIGTGDEFAPSHAHKATAQTPTVAARLTARAALRNTPRRIAEARWFCATTRGLDATDCPLIA